MNFLRHLSVLVSTSATLFAAAQSLPVPSVALASCTGGPASWYTFTRSDLAFLQHYSIQHVSVGVPMSFSVTALQSVLSSLNTAGIKVHLVPHWDGAEESTWQYVIFDHPSQYIAKFQQICTAVAGVPNSVASIELWNEAVDTRTNWGTYTPLYQLTAPTLASVVRQTLPGVQVVLPLPIDQSPEEAQLFSGGAMVSFALFSFADAVSGHVYPTENYSYPYRSGYSVICARRDALVAAAKMVGKPLYITEMGVSQASPGYLARIADTAKAYAADNIPIFVWELHGNPGQYDLFNNPASLIAAGGFIGP